MLRRKRFAEHRNVGQANAESILWHEMNPLKERNREVSRSWRASSSQAYRYMERITMLRAQLRHVAGGDLFTPQAVTIVPYHNQRVGSSPPFPSTEDQKTKAVRDIGAAGRDLEGLKQVVAELEPRVRGCYRHPLHPEMMDSGLFSRMMLHDACYLLCFLVDFVKHDDDGGEQEHHNITETKDNTLVRDILYQLENQIPLFLLDRMYEHIRGRQCGGEAGKWADEWIATPSDNYCRNSSTSATRSSLCRRRPPRPPALTFSTWSTPTSGGTAGGRSLTGRWRRATDYSRHANCWVFTPGDEHDDGWTILDIRYDDRGTLYVPFLRVGGSTFTMLRDLMALEEQLQAERPVTAYCCLIWPARRRTSPCVALDIDSIQQNYLKPIWHQLDRRCRMRVHGFKGLFREQYGRNMFNAMVFCLAFILFVCQVIQVVYAVLAYHRPPK
ncbi:LOW QUALITY PROTEIN: hypothetical protein U9M48_000503 [Paspalum notatum var. saurae]|uniref:Uncharacterized protein n=1 Tax=Paspalum notatum var. saurae TaxID=547442 RepID=A0AAQ3PFA4_PASNO